MIIYLSSPHNTVFCRNHVVYFSVTDFRKSKVSKSLRIIISSVTLFQNTWGWLIMKIFTWSVIFFWILCILIHIKTKGNDIFSLSIFHLFLYILDGSILFSVLDGLSLRDRIDKLHTCSRTRIKSSKAAESLQVCLYHVVR